MRHFSAEILALVMATAGALLALGACTPAAAQSQSPIKDVFLTEIDVKGAPSSYGLPGHGILDGLAHLSGTAITPVLMICAQENTNANGTPNHYCSDSRACVHTYDCNAILLRPLPLTSEDASVDVVLYDVASPGNLAVNSQFVIPTVSKYDSTSLTSSSTFVPSNYPGTMVTVKLKSDYTKAIGTATGAIKALAKRKLPLPEPSPGDFGAGAANELTKENLSYDRCLGSHTTSSTVSAQDIFKMCGSPGDPGYAHCVINHFPNEAAQGACLTSGSGAQIEQPVNGTLAESVKAYECRVFAWVPNFLTPDSIAQKCNPGVPAGTAAQVPAQTETQYEMCLRNAINNYGDLAAQANNPSVGCDAKSGNAKTTCLENILEPALDVSKPTPNNFIARSQQFAACQQYKALTN
jgi:hypothetical protein